MNEILNLYPVYSLFAGWLILINFIAYGMFWTDKIAAQKGQWRKSDKQLIGLSIIGGSIGAILGVRFASNKSRRSMFKARLYAILIVHFILAIIFITPEFRDPVIASLNRLLSSLNSNL